MAATGRHLHRLKDGVHQYIHAAVTLIVSRLLIPATLTAALVLFEEDKNPNPR